MSKRNVGTHFEAVLADWPPERQQEALTTLHALAEALEHGRDEASPPPPAPPTGDRFP